MSGRLCKHEGCTRPIAGRGMCKDHYEVWRRKNPDIIMTRMNEAAVLESMPGTLSQLIQRTGLCRPAVERALRVLNVAGSERQAYIHDYVPPGGRGKRWDPIYKPGKQGNLRLTKERKRAHSLMLNRVSYAARNGTAPAQSQRASWMDALGIPP